MTEENILQDWQIEAQEKEERRREEWEHQIALFERDIEVREYANEQQDRNIIASIRTNALGFALKAVADDVIVVDGTEEVERYADVFVDYITKEY